MIRHLKMIAAGFLACAVVALAHGGFDHVGGTVVKLENSVMTVKTTRGNVAIRLDAKTEITLDGKSAQAADLKQGVKVVVDVPEAEGDSKEKVAHLIKIGAAAKAATATAAHDHDAHDHDHDAHK